MDLFVIDVLESGASDWRLVGVMLLEFPHSPSVTADVWWRDSVSALYDVRSAFCKPAGNALLRFGVYTAGVCVHSMSFATDSRDIPEIERALGLVRFDSSDYARLICY